MKNSKHCSLAYVFGSRTVPQSLISKTGNMMTLLAKRILLTSNFKLEVFEPGTLDIGGICYAVHANSLYAKIL